MRLGISKVRAAGAKINRPEFDSQWKRSNIFFFFLLSEVNELFLLFFLF